MIVEYRIDATDRIVAVNPEWAQFARDNDAPDLAVLPLDQPLWSYVTDPHLAMLWKSLVERVRASGQSVRVPFRCDAPWARRWLVMTLDAEPHDVVRFCSTLLREEPREHLAILDAHTARDLSLAPLRMCAWCNRCHDGTAWVEL